jgi:hypothetical protein
LKMIARLPGQRLLCDATHVASACVVFMLGSLGPALCGETGEANPVVSARDMIAKWVEVRETISREKKEWREGRGVLEGRIELLEQEVAQLQKKIDEDLKKIEGLDSKRAEVDKAVAQLDESSELLARELESLEADVARRLVKTLPDPLREKLVPLTQKIPDNPKDTPLTMAERYQNVIGVLNEVNKFNGLVSVVSEIRSAKGGAPKQVKTLYLGVGQGYFVSADGDFAGVGTPGEDGWAWEDARASSGSIKKAIAMLDSKQGAADFVPLPVKVEDR